MSLFIRGAVNKKLADDLKYTANMNKKLVEHYQNYPNTPETFPQCKALYIVIYQKHSQNSNDFFISCEKLPKNWIRD